MFNLNQLALKLAWIIRGTELNIENPLKEAWRRIKEDKTVRLAIQILVDVRSSITDFQTALKKAIFCRKLRKALLACKPKQAVKFQFLKTNKTLRPALGTSLSASKLQRKGKGKPYSGNGYYFDIEKGASRSFKIENLVIAPIEIVNL